MTLTPGTRLGPYEILAAIEAGGMGEVYKARDTRLDRSVAIKVLPAHVSADPERRARFEREAKTIAGLNHSHICTLYDVGEHDGSTFLVMEHLTGETLAQHLEKGPLPLEQALTVATETADALAANGLDTEDESEIAVVHECISQLVRLNILTLSGTSDEAGDSASPPVAGIPREREEFP